ncbi:MAG: 23S rRNA (guanosine(2251)-2'-O)-methyltransferase RlmB [Endozoicomonadaceae bacterium]|nr:23S rRNA (guanosine(2251)-2'-O)-methyltransferase RlmB [Endozoicomonadaceae bacterium]
MLNDDLVYGFHAVQNLLEEKADYIRSIWIQIGHHSPAMQDLIDQIKTLNITLQFVNRLKLDREVKKKHQGILAWIQPVPVYVEKDLLILLDALNVPALLLILDGVTDPHNLGACLRSAEASGAHAVIAPKHHAAPLNSTVSKVACGAAEKIPFFTVNNLANLLKILKKRGIWLMGTADEVAPSLYDTELIGDIALVMGSEGVGLRRLTRNHCDQLMSIPMKGKLSSLNVSVATGICLFEAVRQRCILTKPQ